MKQLLKNIRQHLMCGVSYMIPFVVAGGVLLAISVLFNGNASIPPEGTILYKISRIGSAGLGMMVPILSGYIAFSMADRPAIAPGIIGGVCANEIGAGFLGGIMSGVLAGIIVFYIKKIKIPKVLRSVIPIFIIPLFSSLVVGAIMMFLIGLPIANLMDILQDWLYSVGTTNTVLIGLILGAMIAFDMGGPVNKVAFGFGVALVGTINQETGMADPMALKLMGAIGVAICTPPIGMGIATLLAPKKYSLEEQESGKASIIMGLVGVTEGAIPFAASDPFRVIPCLVVGSACGAVTSLLLGAGNPAPWGGLIVLPVANGKLAYIIATLVGVFVTAFTVNLLKKPIKEIELSKYTKTNELDLDFE